MRVFYSTSWFVDSLKSGDVRKSSGWGRFIHLVEKTLRDLGIEIETRNPCDADIELFLGQPFFYNRPQLQPSITYTMWESTEIYPEWVQSYNRWNRIIVPSDWNREVFINSGVTTSIEKLWLPVWLESFPKIERDIDSSTWNYLVQGVSVNDRKMIPEIADLFYNNKMPSDTMLTIKVNPNQSTLPTVDAWIHPQIHLIQARLPIEQYYEQIFQFSHVSINSSAGEGFGYLATEPMASGMCCLLTDFSAHQEFIRQKPEICLPIHTDEIKVQSLFRGGPYIGNMGLLDTEHCRKQMLWTYEHREEAMQIGKYSSEWIRKSCDPTIIVSQLIDIMSKVIKSEKRAYIPVPIDRMIDWQLFSSLYGVNKEDIL